MKQFIRLMCVSILVLCLSITSIQAVQAIPETGWQTGIKLQNLGSIDGKTLSLTLYPSIGGAPVQVASNLAISANGSLELFLPSYTNVPGGKYAAVVSSDVPLASVATLTNYENGMADSYTSMQPASTIYIPSVYHNHNNWSTDIFIQNTTGSPVNASVKVEEPATSVSTSDGLFTQEYPIVVPANSSYQFDTNAHPEMNWFIGAATVKSTGGELLAVNISQTRLLGAGDVPGNALIMSRGLSGQDISARILLPSLYKNFSGASGTWQSGIKLQNPGTAAVNATVTFTGDGSSTTYVKSVNVPASGSTELYLPNTLMDNSSPLPDMFIGSAVVEAVGGTIIASVQHTNYSAASGYGVAIGYPGLAVGSSKISLPSLYRWPSGAGVWISGIKVQNLGTTEISVNIVLASDPDVAAFSGSKSNVIIAPGKAFELYLGADGNLDGGLSVPQPWKGGAIVTAVTTSGTGTASIGATVIHTNYGRHVSTMYTGMPINK